ncbi:MAG: ABC transporter ATP-binding protein [Sphingobacteriia bacterium]|nr:ABC transporter ATP-binding protein [Sphingobacteriia bacterium]
MLKANHVHKSYGNLQVLKGLSIEIKAGEIVALTGSSGAGKSTFLQILGTLDEPDQGEVYFKEVMISKLGEAGRAKFRNENLGFVFQFHYLLPEFTALENVCIPGWIGNRSSKEVKARALELLNYLGLTDRIHHMPSQLSGGEQQRVAFARALINQPALILADEPTGNLDSANAFALMELVKSLSRELSLTFLIATHQPDLVTAADRILHMRDGQFVTPQLG